MSPVWTETVVPQGGFQEGQSGNLVDDFFIDVLFEGALGFAVMPWTGTEKTVPVAAYTKRTGALTPWTEKTP